MRTAERCPAAFLRARCRGSRLVSMDMPETRYARSGDVMVAHQMLGQGPFDVVIAPPWVSHVELVWEIASWTALLRGFAEHAGASVRQARHWPVRPGRRGANAGGAKR